jgi:hypothetical protein
MISTGTLMLGSSQQGVNATSWQYFDASYNFVGEIDSSGSLFVNSGFPGWPAAARVGDSGSLGSVTIYSNQAMSTVTGTQQLGYALSASPDNSPDSAMLTLTTVETDVNPVQTSTQTDRYLITQSGSVTYVSNELKVEGAIDILSTVTSFAPLLQPSAMASGAMMVMGPDQRHAAARSLRALPAHHLLRLLRSQLRQRAP